MLLLACIPASALQSYTPRVLADVMRMQPLPLIAMPLLLLIALLPLLISLLWLACRLLSSLTSPRPLNGFRWPGTHWSYMAGVCLVGYDGLCWRWRLVGWFRRAVKDVLDC